VQLLVPQSLVHATSLASACCKVIVSPNKCSNVSSTCSSFRQSGKHVPCCITTQIEPFSEVSHPYFWTTLVHNHLLWIDKPHDPPIHLSKLPVGLFISLGLMLMIDMCHGMSLNNQLLVHHIKPVLFSSPLR
jgi:hypothetical protein